MRTLIGLCRTFHGIGLIAAAAALLLTGQATAQALIHSQVTPEHIAQARRSHWSFQPIDDPALPAVEHEGWVRSPIDRFVLAKLEENNLTPSSPADRQALLRRAYFDLIGLPPTYEQVRAFIEDESPDAFEKVIDHLLASPRYGERWGRHWLDVARYADTKGYVGGGEDRRYPFSYTYRDYVIRAFNNDKPYDRFILEQLAADKLDLGDDKRPLAAMGFLTVGRRFTNDSQEIIDDRIDVVTRGLMGLTVQCARCHDHKYDPIPTADYYSLYGVFASSEEPDELPVIAEPSMTPEYKAYLAEEKKREQAVETYIDETSAAIIDELRSRAADYLVYIARTHPNHQVGGDQVPFIADRGAMRRRAARRWERYLDEQKNQPQSVFTLWHRLIDLKRDGFADAALAVIEEAAAPEGGGADDEAGANPLLLAALKENPPDSMADVAATYGKLLEDVHQQWKELVEAGGGGAEGNPADPGTPGTPGATHALSDPAAEQLRQVMYAPGTPTTPDRETAIRLFNQGERNKLRAVRNQVAQWRIESPAAPPRAMVMADRQQMYDPYIFRRGNPGNRGESVPRRFLQVLSHVDGGEPYEKSGRLALAQAIVDADNPLTARVMVNRVWRHHFGKGLVETPSDFGFRSQPPSHPLMLDYLAARFMEGGWSIKDLHRTIMLSATYRQASDSRPDFAAVDVENRLLWRMNRRRIEFEPMRDALLAIAGHLDKTLGGRPVDLLSRPYSARRTVYGFIDRQNLPGVFRTFDFASPDASCPGRPRTTVPQQALYMMNNPFVVRQAQRLTDRVTATKGIEERIAELYHLVFSRDPAPAEVELARRFIETAPSASDAQPPPAVWRYGYGQYDPDPQRVVGFTPLPHFTDDRWQGGAEFPDPRLHYLLLTPTGGHVGADQAHAVVRRWTAPFDGIIQIRGVLKHSEEEGDGVRGRIVSSRAGLLGEWTVENAQATTTVDSIEVRAGDTIDFIVDCRANGGWDSFEWTPTVNMLRSPRPTTENFWDAAVDFSGTQTPAMRLTLWEQYAQALLMSNEFVFVD